ncbi:hypothetical protein AAVH_21250 [Aphelenchoides avenae]|nr:hypothetical protein AAVH_21250 [Aphelenchus avenae]
MRGTPTSSVFALSLRLSVDVGYRVSQFVRLLVDAAARDFRGFEKFFDVFVVDAFCWTLTAFCARMKGGMPAKIVPSRKFLVADGAFVWAKALVDGLDVTLQMIQPAKAQWAFRAYEGLQLFVDDTLMNL